MNSSSNSVGLFLDDTTLWSGCVEPSFLGGQSKLKTSFKYDLDHIPGEPTRKMYFISEAVKLVVSKLGVSAGGMAMVFPDADAFVRYFEMPQIPGADMRTAVSFEAQKYMPFSIKELYFDFKVFPNSTTKKQGLLHGAHGRPRQPLRS